MKEVRALSRLTEEHTPEENFRITEKQTFGVLREYQEHKKSPVLYEPMIVMVSQGVKRAYIGEEVFEYGPGDVLVMVLPIPVATEIVSAGPEEPFLAAIAAIDMDRFLGSLLKIERAEEGRPQARAKNASSIYSARADGDLINAFTRLVRTFDNQRDSEVLSEAIIDEIYYRVLVGERSDELRYLLRQRGEILRVSRALEHINENLDKPVSVEELAGLVHMSRSAFFEHFKSVMHVSPLQYAKSVKLHRANVLIQKGKKVNEAAYSVGYNNAAQFSREFRRQFGVLPSAV